MKKTLILGILLAIAAPVMANADLDILREARDNYYKNQKAPKTAKKVTAIKGENANAVIVEEIVVEEEVVIEEEKPKKLTQLEKLEATAAEAADKVDFYQRVVRSVAREEKELADYNAVIKGNTKKPVKKSSK